MNHTTPRVTTLRGHAKGNATTLPASVAEALPGLPFSRSNWKRILAELLRRHNWGHGSRAKSVSFKTMEERATFLYAFFQLLRDDGMAIDPRSLRSRHIEHALRRWIER